MRSYLQKEIFTIFILFSIVAFLSCCKEPEPVKPTPAELTFYFSHSWDNDSFNMDTLEYITDGGDKVSVEELAYRIAQVRFHRPDGGYYDAGNYELILADKPESFIFKIPGLPEGIYKSISFKIGVDSLRNHTGAQNGALDPSNGLYWEWNTGYIFSMIEGRWDDSGMSESYSYHIGTDQFLINHKEIPLPSFEMGKTNRNIHLRFNVAEIFKNPFTIKLKTDGDFTHSTDHLPLASKIRDNFSDCISLIKIE